MSIPNIPKQPAKEKVSKDIEKDFPGVPLTAIDAYVPPYKKNKKETFKEISR